MFWSCVPLTGMPKTSAINSLKTQKINFQQYFSHLGRWYTIWHVCYPREKPVRLQQEQACPKLTSPLPSQPESSHVYKVYFNWDHIIYSLLFHIGDLSNYLLSPHLVWYCTSHKSHKLFGLLKKSYHWIFLQIYPIWNYIHFVSNFTKVLKTRYFGKAFCHKKI